MRLLKKYYSYLAGLIIFCVYLKTLAPTIINGDTGELATVQCTLGIAHPTGYPLFTILGYLFSLIPLPFTKIYQLNLLCAIWTSLSAIVFILMAKLILDNITELNTINNKTRDNFFKRLIISGNLSELQKYLIAVASGFILAFSRTFWFQSTSVEVYSLNLFLVNLTLLYLLKAYFEKEEKQKLFSRNWLLAAVFFALALSNHRSVIYILPGAAYLFLLKYRLNLSSLKKAGVISGLIGLITFIVYLYLPIRAAQKPLMNWGDPSSPEALMDVFMGKYYQDLARIEINVFLEKIRYFFSTLMINFSLNELEPNEFSLSIVFALIGIIITLFFYRRIFIFLSLIILTSIIFTSLYNIPDSSSYFLNAYIAIAAFSVFGISIILFFFLYKISRILVFVLVSIFIISQIYFNYYKTTLDDGYLTYDISVVLLLNVDKNAIIVSNAAHLFPLYYLQYVEGMRKDVIFVSRHLLQYAWYREQLKKIHPEIKYKFKDNNYEVENKNRSLYVTHEMLPLIDNKSFNLPADAKLVPDIFLYKSVFTDDYVPVKMPNYMMRYSFDPTFYELKENFNSISVLIVRLLYEVQHKKYKEAKIILQKIKEVYPKYTLPKEFISSEPELTSD